MHLNYLQYNVFNGVLYYLLWVVYVQRYDTSSQAIKLLCRERHLNTYPSLLMSLLVF